ncbi:UNVERIFIED_CONTAM: LuxR family two component transcriptional regulator [Acetivibrio alkalicellulosi]
MEKQKTIRLFLVDDDINWLKAMTSFLHGFDDFMVVGNSTSRREAVEMSKTLDFDFVLMDMNFNGNIYEGIYATSEILKHKKSNIIMLTSMEQEHLIKKSFDTGVIDFVNKEDYESIPFIVRRSIKKNATNKLLISEIKRLKREENLKDLTATERDIFELAEKGLDRTQIVSTLCRSENTIKKQITSILRKLDAPNMKEAVDKINNGDIF